MTEIASEYKARVIVAWDNASEEFKIACIDANTSSFGVQSWLLQPDGELIYKGKTLKIKAQTDGVWTKVDIYISAFETLARKYQKSGSKGKQETLETCIEIWQRMFLDLIAMNADDMRDGKRCISLTNIIDINQIHPDWAEIFVMSFSNALKKVIEETGIAIVAWETAILWDNRREVLLYKIIENITSITTELLQGRDCPELKAALKQVEKTKKMLTLNAWGSALWIEFWTQPKISRKPESGDVVIALSEKPTTNGIIWPRANGMSAICKWMEKILWEKWHNLTFDDYWSVLDGNQRWRFINIDWGDTYKQLKGVKLWDIATGKTTVFNGLISEHLLWWLHHDPIVEISSLIHITWNPLRKISEGIWSDKLVVKLDIQNVKIPQIIIMLQIALGFSDQEGLDILNMWIPYVVCVKKKDAQTVLDTWNALWVWRAQIVWIIEKKQNQGDTGVISGVGIGKSEVHL